ncbi:MAG: cell division protein FtsA [Gammaproteobacteria bacterium]|nr:cell division protein FtsA [Gammaproteobacteria bacterium]
MAKKKLGKNLIVGLDVGTSKIVTLVGELDSNNQIEVIGIGSHPSKGLKRGVVVNIDATVNAIQHAVEEAELMAGCQIHSAFTGIAGGHIRSLNSHGIVAIREQEVDSGDVTRVLEAASAVPISTDQKILHILPQEFIIDNQPGIKEPIGMSGVRLEAKVHMVTGAVSAAQNIIKCVQRCGLEIAGIILEPLASSHAVLNEDEKESGVCLIDIGGGTTDIAIFTHGAIRHTAVIPIAGDQVTSDIAIALQTPSQYAEELKLKQGCALASLIDESDSIEIPSLGDRPRRRIPRKMLAEVIESRYEELLTLIHNEIHRSGYENHIPAGIVITGGATKINGLLELADRILKVPVRLGTPQYIAGLNDVINNPVYATSAGLLLMGSQQHYQPVTRSGEKNAWSRMRDWFKGNF